MNRIEREKRVVGKMVEIYCRQHHHNPQGGLCEECRALLEYAHRRLDHCPKGESKTSCRKCRIHCYAPDRRERIREVMRYVGPRMILIHPLDAIRHLITEIK